MFERVAARPPPVVDIDYIAGSILARDAQKILQWLCPTFPLPPAVGVSCCLLTALLHVAGCRVAVASRRAVLCDQWSCVSSWCRRGVVGSCDRVPQPCSHPSHLGWRLSQLAHLKRVRKDPGDASRLQVLICAPGDFGALAPPLAADVDARLPSRCVVKVRQ
jgi:hypothetical protein